MRKLTVAAAPALCGLAVATTIAYAQQPAPSPVIVKATGSASKGKGTPKKPVPVSATASIVMSTADGSRVESVKTIDHAWGGVVSNGKLFPTCSIDAIAAAQSDAGCPKGSLIASGKLDAVLGPDSDFSNPGAMCSKSVRVYNAGQDKAVYLLVGPGSTCAGVGYLPPFPAKWEKFNAVDKGQSLNVPIPTFIGHPLPGVLGSISTTTLTFPKRTVKVKGRKRGYLESIGCKGKRTYSNYLLGDPDGEVLASKSSAGAC